MEKDRQTSAPDPKGEPSRFWIDTWDAKAGAPSDFQATGRGNMDVVGFLYTLREIVHALDLPRYEGAVLDVGCGTGIIPLALSPWVKTVIGMDLSQPITRRAVRNSSDAPNLSYCTGSITALPIRSGRLGRVLAYSVLQYLSGPREVEKALSEIARVLRPDGIAYLAANPDPARKQIFIQAVQNLPVDEERKKEALRYVDLTLWLSEQEILEIVSRLGLAAEVRLIHTRIWQSSYMFDFLLRKSHG